MISIVKALLWERWRRTRWAVIAGTLLTLSGQIMYLTGYISQEKVIPISKTFWFLGFLCLTIVLLAGHCESRDLDFSFPKRLFRYPVKTSTLFFVYMGYGGISVAFQSLILFVFEKLFSDQVSFTWTHFSWFFTVYILMQTLAWLSWLPGQRARFICLAPLLTGLYVCLLLCLGGYYNPSVNINLLFLTILISLGVSFWGISAQRKGICSRSSQWAESLFGIFRRNPSKPFTSALHAQIWFESRQKGHIFPMSALCTIIILLIWWKFVLGTPPILSQAIPVILMITVCIAFVSNFLIFGLDNREYVSRASFFWMRIPLPTQTLAAAKLYSMLLSLGIVIAIILIVASAIVFYEHGCWAAGSNYVYLITPVKWAWGYKSPLEIISMTIFGLYGFLIIYWTMLRLGFLLFFVGIAAIFSSWLLTTLFGDVASTWMWEALFISLPLIMIISFYFAKRLQLIATTTIVVAAFLFPIVVISLWSFPWGFFSNDWGYKGLADLSLSHAIMLTSSATLSFLPVALTPLIINRLRHR
ncbi:MAG: hypothetical protein JW927_17710 [Deltaproteobacteria bacterium]|nr:hypothetical protein [Deltaproteobacteria bacterium]